jgi:glycosyltransferase involved in cell wall biosynthesis
LKSPSFTPLLSVPAILSVAANGAFQKAIRKIVGGFGVLSGKRARESDQSELGTDRPRYLMVDVSVIIRNDAKTGIQRVVRALWLHLRVMKLPGIIVVPVFASRAHGYRYADPDFLALDREKRTANARDVAAQPGDIFLGLDLSAHLLTRHKASLLGWKRLRIPLHFIVYDLLPINMPQWFNRKTVKYFRRWMRIICHVADSAICISEEVHDAMRDVIAKDRIARTREVKVKTIRMGADLEASVSKTLEPTRSSAADVFDDRPFVLMVGTVEPRKGYDFALEVFEQIWRSGNTNLGLVIVGRPGWKTQKIQRHIKASQYSGKYLHWLSNVDDDFLLWLYDNCSLLLMASRAEGFGLPVVEARARGVPVVATDLRVFRDMRDGDIRFFQQGDVTGAAQAILEVSSLEHPIRNPPPKTVLWADATSDILVSMELSCGDDGHG